MPTQNDTGNAYEYAVATALQNSIGANAFISANSKRDQAQRAYMALSLAEQQLYFASAKSAAEFLIKLEPTLHCNLSGRNTVSITLQADRQGQLGDVRDIVVKNIAFNWEIGISAKHQNEDVKHSRLSPHIDFGKGWFDQPCSSNYFAEVEPIFTRLTNLNALATPWSSVADKEKTVYVPLLNAFKKELFALDNLYNGVVPSRLVRYLIGRQDFYKVIKQKGYTKFQIFNFHGSLGKARNRVKPIVKIEKPILPSRILHLDFVQKDYIDTLELVFDAGWHLLLRIHSASNIVEPSLKFAISILGQPRSLQSFITA